jgi:prevent-host-death family protein
METISATEAKNNFGALLLDVQRRPITIRSHNKDTAVLISAESYESYRKFQIEEFKRISNEMAEYAASQGLTQEILDDILAEENP